MGATNESSWSLGTSGASLSVVVVCCIADCACGAWATAWGRWVINPTHIVAVANGKIRPTKKDRETLRFIVSFSNGEITGGASHAILDLGPISSARLNERRGR